jgi:serine/threonine-protein kinase
VIGSYRLLELLGEGGMGFVYLAEHVRLGRRVAIKMLRSRYATNPVAVKRFFREARAVNQIRNENIVEITDFIEQEGEDSYYIMELLEGESVADILERDGFLPLDRVLAIVIQICDALGAVHGAEIVHRDLKPDNIFLIERSGHKDFVKLVDFGVAKLEDPVDDRKAHQTAGGAILGTPEYMSPEQASSKPVDFRTDIYALGVILYEMLTGKKPFTGHNYGELVIKHVTIPPPPPSQLEGLPQAVPAEIEELILHCLEKEPDGRPEDMHEVGARLRKYRVMSQAGQAELAPPEAVGARPRRRIGLIAAVALVILAGAAAVLASLWRSGTERDKPATPAEVPPLAPVEAASKEVRIWFDSDPPGAGVFMAGSQDILGTTPVEVSLDRSETPETFELKLKGHETAQQTIPLHEDARVFVKLPKQVVVTKAPPAKKKRRRKKKRRKRKKKQKDSGSQTGKEKKDGGTDGGKKPVDLGGTLDPFSEE